jgi:hypothetical protein
MILNRRHNAEEKFIRKVMVLVRLSKDSSIKDQSDVSRYIHEMFKDLSFEESKDILIAWKRLQDDPYHYIGTDLVEEMLEFFLD